MCAHALLNALIAAPAPHTSILIADGLSTAAEGDGAGSAGVAHSDAEAASGSGECASAASPHASSPGIDEHDADRDSDAGRA